MRTRLKQTGLLLLLSTLIFLILYRRFLIGSAVYLYTDIGSDSISSSYPILVMLSRLFQRGDFSFFTLSSGLGSDTSATFLQYVNPLKAFLLLFGRSSMPAGILIQLYLETLLTAWASFRFFQLHTRHAAASMGAALLFAYSSYAVLWSQNLSYGLCVSMFALAMFALEAFLRSRTLPRFLALAGVLALYLFTNYFFCYMTALFVIAYIPIRAIFLREGFRSFLLQFLETGFSALCALLMSAAAVAAILGSFLGSVRTGDATRSLTSFLKMGVDPKMFFACLSRLFSENLAGIGDKYQGPDNYYEIAVLAVGALFFFSFCYLLFQKKFRLKALFLLLLCTLCLLLPIARYLLNMNWLVMRFSFWICLLECLAIALFLRELFTAADRRGLIVSVAGALCFAGVCLAFLFANETRLGFSLSRRELLFFLAFFGAYALVLLLLGIKPLKIRLPWALSRKEWLLPGLFFLLIAAEILVMRHDTLYLRLYLTKDQFGNSAFSDDVQLAVEEIQKEDPELCRISSTEDYFYANEGLVDGFNATSLYNNTNPASLRSLVQAHGTYEVSIPYFISSYPEYDQFTLLAGRYLIRRESAGDSITDPALFERTASYPLEDGRELAVYRNRNALPFGYFLGSEITEEEYLDSDLVTRMELLTKHWYRTGGAGNDSADASAETDSADAAAEADSAGAASGNAVAGAGIGSTRESSVSITSSTENQHSIANTKSNTLENTSNLTGGTVGQSLPEQTARTDKVHSFALTGSTEKENASASSGSIEETDAANPTSSSEETHAGSHTRSADEGAEEAVTDGTSSKDIRLPLAECAQWKDPHNLEMKVSDKGVTFTPTGEDPYIYVYLDRSAETADTSNYIYMKVRAKNKNTMRTIALYYFDENSVPSQDFMETIFYTKYYPESLTLLPEGISGFRFDIDEDAGSVTLSSLDLLVCPDPLEHFQELADTEIRNISLSGDLYTADLTAPSGGGILCVPILYTSGWSAAVNGQPAEVLNVNGGLLGIPVGPGASHIELRYQLPHFALGLVISLISCGLYLAAWIYVVIRRRRSR